MDFFKNLMGTEVEPQKVNNFPPFCPFMYLSLSECGNKKIMCILGVIEYILFCVIVLANFAGSWTAMFGTKSFERDFMGLVVMSAIYVFFIPFCAFFLQFYAMYGACKSANPLRYLFFYISYSLGVIFNFLMAVGVPGSGGCGLIGALWCISKKNWVGTVFLFIMMGIWIVNGLFLLIMMVVMIKFFRDDGITFSSIKDSIMGKIARRSITSAVQY